MPALMATATGPLGPESEALVNHLRRSLVTVRCRHGQGSGVVWDGSGLVITNDHVVDGGPVEVETADGRTMAAVLVARDPGNDLAALRVPGDGPPAASIGRSSDIRVGELVVAVGHPLGMTGTATLGIVSARPSPMYFGRTRRELLQADVALAPGNSGGPLADASGRVIGIASMVLSPGVAIAIPSDVVQRFVEAVNRARIA